MNDPQEELDLRFAGHLLKWRGKVKDRYIGAEEVVTLIESLWDHTLATQGRDQRDLSGRVTCLLKYKGPPKTQNKPVEAKQL